MKDTIRLFGTLSFKVCFKLCVFVLAAAVGIGMVACDSGTTSSGEGGDEDIEVSLVSVTANGNGSQTTTALTLTFSDDVAGLAASDVRVSGSGVTKGALTGSGKVYTLAVTVTKTGRILVTVDKAGYRVANALYVDVFVATVAGKPVELISVDKVGGDGETTRALVLTFSERVPGLSTSDIILGGAGANAFKGALRGSENVYTMSITNFTAGDMTVNVQKDGYNFTGGQKTVPVYIKQVVWGEGTPVTLSYLYANTPNLRSTSIYLLFDTEIRDLREENIVLTSTEPNGTVGTVMKGVLEAPYFYTYDTGSGTMSVVLYNLGVYGNFANNTEVEVEVRKDGYKVTDTSGGNVILYNKKAVGLLTASTDGDEEDEVTSTELILTFSGTVPGIIEEPTAFIRIDAGLVDVQLNSGRSMGGYTYAFPLVGFSRTVDAIVTVDNDDFYFSPDSAEVTLYYYAPAAATLADLARLINEIPVNGTGKINYTGTLDAQVNTVIRVATNKNVILDITGTTTTAIIAGLLDNLPNLVGVVLPSTTASIAANSFAGSGLKEVEINGPPTVPAVFALPTIETVIIGEDVTSVTAAAFGTAATSNIKEVVLNGPSDGTDVFKGFTTLQKVTLGDTVESTATDAFMGCTGLSIVDLGNGVLDLAITEGTFDGCTSLRSITIPDSVVSIGDRAFKGTSLATINIPGSVNSAIGDNAFEGCTSLTTVTMGSGVPEIGASAFSGCTSLSTVTMPTSVSTIGASAFEDCTSLQGITLSTRVREIDEATFKGSGLRSINIVNMTSIGESAFEDCTSLTSVTLGTVLTEIGADAFKNTGLSEITFPAGTYTIGAGAFDDCESLETVVINGGPAGGIGIFAGTNIKYLTVGGSIAVPDDAYTECPELLSVTFRGPTVGAIGNNAFDGCAKLATLAFASNVTTVGNIGDFAFKDTRIASVAFPGAVGTIGEGAFVTEAVIAPATDPVSLLTSVTFGGAVGGIGEGAFKGTNITSLSFPAAITAGIGASAFEDCALLASVIFNHATASPGPYSIGDTIGASAFKGCVSLTSIIIPASVETIDENAFTGTRLTSVTINGALAEDGATTLNAVWPVTIPGTYNGITSLTLNAAPHADGVVFPTTVNNLTLGNAGTIASTNITPLTGITDLTLNGSVKAVLSDLTGVIRLNIGPDFSLNTLTGSDFDTSAALTTITADTDNDNYTTIDGVLFNKVTVSNVSSATKLIKYPVAKQGTTLTLGATVVTVDEKAITGPGTLTTLVINGPIAATSGTTGFITGAIGAGASGLINLQLNESPAASATIPANFTRVTIAARPANPISIPTGVFTAFPTNGKVTLPAWFDVDDVPTAGVTLVANSFPTKSGGSDSESLLEAYTAAAASAAGAYSYDEDEGWSKD